jgi:hypothetical protein
VSTVVDGLFDRYAQIVDYLDEHNEVTFASDLRALQAKVILLASASYFEDEVKACILKFFTDASSNHRMVYEFVRNKALERQYHTLFNWDAKNVNTFWRLFGDEFKKYAEERVNGDAELAEGAAAFIRIGSWRNSLVHTNYASFNLDSTAAEIYESYKKALVFVERLPAVLAEFPAQAPAES